jgi:hypothetical protein
MGQPYPTDPEHADIVLSQVCRNADGERVASTFLFSTVPSLDGSRAAAVGRWRKYYWRTQST